MINLEVKPSILKYKGYIGQVELDEKAKILSGRVIGFKDVITFHGETVDEVIQAFHDSVDDYLDFCKELKQKPEKSFSGNIPFRAEPEDHYEIYMASQLAGMSISAWMRDVVVRAAKGALGDAEENTAVSSPGVPQVAPLAVPKVAVVSGVPRPVKRADTSYGMKRCLVRTYDVNGGTLTVRCYRMGDIVEERTIARSAPKKGIATPAQPLRGRTNSRSLSRTRELEKVTE